MRPYFVTETAKQWYWFYFHIVGENGLQRMREGCVAGLWTRPKGTYRAMDVRCSACLSRRGKKREKLAATRGQTDQKRGESCDKSSPGNYLKSSKILLHFVSFSFFRKRRRKKQKKVGKTTKKERKLFFSSIYLHI